MKVLHEDRFSDSELFRMFNVDLSVSCPEITNVKMRHSDAPYYMNDCAVPLWSFRRRKVSKRVRPMFKDTIKSGVTTHEPGTKGRVKDLVAFYAANAANEISAFEV